MAYKRAPITEAVIELRFARPLEQAVIERVTRRLRADYPLADPENQVKLEFDAVTRKAKIETTWTGVRLSSADRADVSFFRTFAFGSSRLAPYAGWEAFQPRVASDWRVLRDTVGPIELSRIGVRYVNRIDVPLDNSPLIRGPDYLNVWPMSPDQLGAPMTAYTMQTVRPLVVDDCILTLNSGIVPSPLIGFASFTLDLDVSRETNLPRRDDELWALVERIRHHKNSIFERCITDRARALFQ